MITSLNINGFYGHGHYTNKSDTIKEETIKNIVDYIKEHIKDKNDIVVLQEFPYKNQEHFNNLSKNFNDETYKIYKPNYIDYLDQLNYAKGKKPCCPNIITCAITKAETTWITPKQESCNLNLWEEHGQINYYNRAISLRNESLNIHLLGLHLPMPNDTYSNVLWDDVIDYCKKTKHNKTIIIGDLNVYAEGTLGKRKLDWLIELKAIDVWDALASEDEKAKHRFTFCSDRKEFKKFFENHNTLKRKLKDLESSSSRLDYALASPNAMKIIKKIECDDSTRVKKDFTDHSAIILYLNGDENPNENK